VASKAYGPRRRHSHKKKKPNDKGFSFINISHATCEGCGKQVYKSRREAKHAAEVLHPGQTMRVYACVNSTVNPPPWHYTHMSAARTAAWKDYENELAEKRRQ